MFTLIMLGIFILFPAVFHKIVLFFWWLGFGGMIAYFIYTGIYAEYTVGWSLTFWLTPWLWVILSPIIAGLVTIFAGFFLITLFDPT